LGLSTFSSFPCSAMFVHPAAASATCRWQSLREVSSRGVSAAPFAGVGDVVALLAGVVKAACLPRDAAAGTAACKGYSSSVYSVVRVIAAINPIGPQVRGN